jgi:hypothetical protein
MRIVVALGGNVLLQRGESPDADIQESRVNSAVDALAPLVRAVTVAALDGLPDPGDSGGILLHRLDELPGRVADWPAGKQPDEPGGSGSRNRVAKSLAGASQWPA